MTYVKAVFLSLVLVLSAGCLGPKVSVTSMAPEAEEPRSPNVTLHMETEFTAEERAEINDAAILWHRQTGGLVTITIVYDLDFSDLIGLNALFANQQNMVIKRDSEDPIVLAADDQSGCDACVLGWMNSGGMHAPGHAPIHGAFVTDRMHDPGELRQVALHEFGHVLGVPHVAARQAIMYPAYIPGRVTCLKLPDIRAFCDSNVCDGRKMYPCE